jgi:hypothetical protein
VPPSQGVSSGLGEGNGDACKRSEVGAMSSAVSDGVNIECCFIKHGPESMRRTGRDTERFAAETYPKITALHFIMSFSHGAPLIPVGGS